MKILVVGGGGYIGSICAELLLDQGHEIAVFDNLSEGHRGAVDPRARFIEGDLKDRQTIDSALAMARPEAVMHFAASALVAESMRDPSKYFRNNISNGLNLLDAMVAAHVERIVFSSTCAIFGPPERLPIHETAPTRPINPYGESKLAFEKILRWYDEIHGLKFVSLRYFNAAGASANFGEDHRFETHLIPNVLKVALGQKPQWRVAEASATLEMQTLALDSTLARQTLGWDNRLVGSAALRATAGWYLALGRGDDMAAYSLASIEDYLRL